MAEKETEDVAKKVNNEDKAEGKENVDAADLGPFEIIIGQLMSPFFFKFQFKNVEYSSGRNKTFLCYSVEQQGAECPKLQGYVEDEHTSMHAEEAFFTEVFKECKGNLKYSIVWHVSSSPCAACASKIAEYLKKNRNVHLTIFMARLFMWEEPEIQQGLRLLKSAGCHLKIMKDPDYNHCWCTFVENEGESFVPWEDLQTSTLSYEGILNEILQPA
ncbi:C-_U-editing enzyme APOBEC-2a isoform X2 [Narcine bancroftii]|uniref:C->U-editing enzyme APOBEC-2a isoform X2 n=1 Tax=Narcine bancroftii TaxID=1343680 RepID=UPI003831A8EA